MIDCPSAYVIDGDTLRCGAERLRLLGVDAPEIERCPRWRTCAPGDGQASKVSLVTALSFGAIRYEPITRDRYGRQVAIVYAGRVNLSCWQLRQVQAIYKPKWDNGRIIARACPLAVGSAPPPTQQGSIIPPPIFEDHRPATAERRWRSPPQPVKRPKPRRPAQEYLTSGDYPPAAIAAREQGRVEFVVLVGTDGRASSCYVTPSSGSLELDRATCQIMKRRARYTPAEDASGRAVPALIFEEVEWRLP